MSDCIINFVDEISEDIEKIMRDDLVEYESSHGIDVNYKRFAMILTDQSVNVMGVLNAFTAFSEIYIDDKVHAVEERSHEILQKTQIISLRCLSMNEINMMCYESVVF